jgi:hypothetical protein
VGSVVGQILPLALGIAVSPIPIVAVILILLSPKPRGASVAFLLGWVLGIVAVVWLFEAIFSTVPSTQSDDPDPLLGVVKISLGLLLLVVAIRQVRRRPGGPKEPDQPKWMSLLTTMNVPKGLGLGFALSAFNPVNLLCAIGAGTTIGSALLTNGQVVGLIAIFTALAASTVAIPVFAYLVATKAMTHPLERLRTWLLRYARVVTVILLLIVGVDLIGKGIGDF